MANKCLLSTLDNPYNPFKDYTSWLMFDIEKGYGCCELMGHKARISDQLTDDENDEEIERAIDEIIKYDFQNIYKKVTLKKP